MTFTDLNICMYVQVHMSVFFWRSEDTFWEWITSFHHNVPGVVHQPWLMSNPRQPFGKPNSLTSQDVSLFEHFGEIHCSCYCDHITTEVVRRPGSRQHMPTVQGVSSRENKPLWTLDNPAHLAVVLTQDWRNCVTRSWGLWYSQKAKSWNVKK